MRALLYCTSIKNFSLQNYVELFRKSNGKIDDYSQKIVCEVEIDKVEEIILNGDEIKCKYGTRSLFSIEEESCLTFDALDYYLNVDKPYGYALHLTNLKVFDRPKELSEYYLLNDNKYILKSIEKAPQNMCRVVDKYRLIFTPNEQYVLISIQPQHLCKILNGEKTIEVRRKVMNCLKEMCDNE